MPEFPQFTDDELDEILKRKLQQHQGKDKAVPRWNLVTFVYGAGADMPKSDDNLQDRQIRYCVERLRRHGWLVCDLGNGRGRYLASSVDEYREFRTSYLKPLRARADVIKLMDKAAQDQFPNSLQPSLFNLDEFRSVLE